MANLSEVQEFYFGKTLFITGATGFLGKLLVEKLLRCCDGIEKLFLLVREKKGKDIYTRFNEILRDPVFDLLKQKVPEFRRKIVLIAGDCSKPELGLSTKDRSIIFEQVNIIFHAAATIKFNEHLREAMNINVQATMDLLHMSRRTPKLEVLMYVSTAYSNVPQPIIREEFYPLAADRSHLQDIINNHSDAEIDRNLKSILGSSPNTYTFTKALAEKEILKICGDMPVGVFRPAIVLATAKEPTKSWIDHQYGPTGLVVATGKGVLRTINCDENVTTDIVPVDYVVNCLIASSLDVYNIYRRSPAPSEPPIYNYVSSVENKITWGELAANCVAKYDDYPFSDAVWYKLLLLNKYRMLNIICQLFMHWMPAIIVDFLTILSFNKPRMLKLNQRLQLFTSTVTYFMTQEIKFCNKRTRKLWEDCSDLDKQLFPFSMAELDWREYFEEYVLGVRRYVLKQKDEEIQNARSRYKRLYYFHRAMCFAIVIIFFYCIYKYLK